MANKRTKIEEFEELPAIRRKSLMQAYPELASQWDYDRNCGWGPEDISYGSKISVHWKCPVAKDHFWRVAVCEVTRSVRIMKEKGPGAYGCPFCHSFRVSKSNSLAQLQPALAKEWNHKRNKFKPDEVTSASLKSVWWQCSNGHEYKAIISNRSSRGSGCSICNRGEPTDLRKYKKVLAQFDWKRNPGIDPYRLPYGIRVNWICTRYASHKWKSGFYRGSGERCPYCRGNKVSKQNNLALYPEIASQLDPRKNGGIMAKDITCSSRMRLVWTCSKGPDHVWATTVASRVKLKTGCPFCLNIKASVTNSLATIHPITARQWHSVKNKGVTPKDVVYRSSKKYFWKCSKGHVWSASPYNRTVRGTGCLRCYLGRE